MQILFDLSWRGSKKCRGSEKLSNIYFDSNLLMRKAGRQVGRRRRRRHQSRIELYRTKV